MTQAESDVSSAQGLTEFEREFVQLFEDGKVTMPGQILNAEDPPDTGTDSTDDVEAAVADAQSDDEELDDDAAEDAQEDDEADASADEGGDGEADDGDEDGDGEEEAPVATASADTELDEDDEGIVVPDGPLQIGTRTFTPAEAVDMQRAYNFAKDLTPEHVTAINALFSGQYQLTPVDGAPVQPSPAPAATAPSTGAIDDDYEPLDPVAAERLAVMEAELATLREQSAATVADRQAAQITQGIESFASERELDPATSARLQQTVYDNGWMPLFAQRTNGDLVQATRAALEFAAQSDPVLRQAEIDRLALEQFEKQRLDSQQTSAKKRKAGSLSGSGGSVSRKVRQPSTPAEMQEAMVSEIASHMNGGQQS